MMDIDRTVRFDRVVVVVLATVIGLANAWADEPPNVLAVEDLDSFENPAPDARIPYGNDPLQFGDLRVPAGPGPHPVAVFIHGGCWLSAYDISHTGKIANALASNGIATWSLEYRRVGDEGGGWPGTFRDIGEGVDHLRQIAGEYELDLDNLISMGHSAGGHLAIWAASRPRIPAGEPVGSTDPLPVHGALALTPAPDLENLHEQQACGHVIDGLMGGSPTDYPDRYRWGSPMANSPGKVAQTIIVGKYDVDWGPSGLRYYETASERGDNIQLIEAPESGHFDIIDPDSTTWDLVLSAARDMLDID
jgi:acetyl esterase/lipase